MDVQDLNVATTSGPLPARRYTADGADATLVFAHGAGAGQDHAWIRGRATDLQERRVTVVTFDFPYRAAGRRLPDRTPVLLAAFQDVVRAVSATSALPVAIGGKSMGGRMATMLAAEPDLPRVLGVVAMGYPLHPPGKPDQLRVAHLPGIRVPVLVLQGERDPFGSPSDVAEHAHRVGAALEVVAVPGGHGFEVPKRSGTQRDVQVRVADQVRAWLDRLLAQP